MPGPIVHLIYAKASGEIYNRKAALGSAIRTIAELLRATGHAVYVNGAAYDDILRRPVHSVLPARAASPWGRFVPLAAKQWRRDRRLAAGHRALEAALPACPRPDAILEILSYGSAVGTRYARATGAPLAVLFDGPVLEEYRELHDARPWRGDRLQRVEGEALRAARRTIVYSPFIARMLAERYGVDPARCEVHHSIDFDRFAVPAHEKPLPARPEVLYLGSFLRWHGVPMLIAAFDRAKRRGSAGRLTLVGDGEDLARCRAIVAGLPTREHIRFAGYLDQEDLRRAKMEAHVGVVPRIPWYSAPVKAFEYAAAGMAILAPGHSTIECMRAAGLPITTFAPDSVEDLQAKLEAALASADAIARASAAVRERTLRTYGFDQDAEFYAGFIARTITDPSRPA